MVAEDSPPAFGNLHAYDDDIVPWIRRMTDEIHEHGAACMIQITHLGRRTGLGPGRLAARASPRRRCASRPTGRIPKEAEDWDIDRIVGQYADAAERMQAGGMDGIEIEAYGHLFDQFWSPLTNQRTDEYGGSFENRLRFALAGAAAPSASGSGPTSSSASAWRSTRRSPGGIDAPTGPRDPRAASRPTG